MGSFLLCRNVVVWNETYDVLMEYKMKKKFISCAILGISFLIAVYLIFFFQANKKFSKLCVSEGKYETLMEQRTETQEELLLGLSFNDYKAVYDSLERCFYYSMIKDDPEAYDPMVGYTGRDGSVKLAVKNINISDEMIADNVTIQLLAYDKGHYREYYIKCTTLPIVSIHFYEEPMDTDVDITFELFDNRAEVQKRELISEGKMRIRGVTTASYEKKGYKVTLVENLKDENPEENQQSVLGMRSDGDWILYAGYNDQEKIRNVFSANLWYETCADNNMFGVKNGMEYRYVEAFFNDHYMGLYGIGFPIDELQLELEQHLKNDNVSEFMLKKMRWSENIENDPEYEAMLNSYEFQWSEDEVFTEENRKKAIEYHHILDTATEDDIDTLYDMADIGNAIDVYLFYNLIQGVDNAHEGDTKNLYLTYRAYGEEGRFLITPWDFDLSWGNEYNWAASYATGQYSYGLETNLIMDKNPVHRLLENDDEQIKELILKRYGELRRSGWSEEAVMQMLDEYEKEIFDSGAFEREAMRWPHAHYIGKEEKLSQFKQYVKERLLVMDEYVADITR